ncbi:aminotransferase class I/II-fold pyridoxal phosphate-dependent enzyme [Candidatus Woesearchaeota archaeon]|nr:aminotransferase class I/II-fold pyridoxal phosphate-dependent enzyme [Candidatus Woesearchaeota archaeon]
MTNDPKEEWDKLQRRIQEIAKGDPRLLGFASAHLGYGSPVGELIGFDFRDANIDFAPFGTDAHELEYLRRIIDTIDSGCETVTEKPLEGVVREILHAETTLELERYNLFTSASGARHALVGVLQKLVTQDKPVVLYASPNWIFDNVMTKVPGAQGYGFHATSAEEFVEGFEQHAQNNVAALILVDPANPLGYRFNREHIERIESIAERSGIVPIFDDPFRALQEEGKRHSSSQYSSRSVIVETTSKRLGARGLGITWTLVPKQLSQVTPEIAIGCQGCENIAAITIDSLYQARYGERIREMLIANSKAFQAGLRSVTDQGEFRQAFPGMPILTYMLPEYLNPREVLGLLDPPVLMTSGFDWITANLRGDPDQDFRNSNKSATKHGFSYLRICPTKEPADRSYVAGVILGTMVQKLKR